MSEEKGWSRLEIEQTGSYARYYCPSTVYPNQPAPLIVFLHGSGATPEHWDSFVEEAAEHTGSLVVLPKSLHSLSWGSVGDQETISEAVRLVKEFHNVDEGKISIAGHSAGGAYAYLLAYRTLSRYNAVFILSAPYYEVSAIVDETYKAPIRMYYGTNDPNYSNGPYLALVNQWYGLGLYWEEDIQEGYSHNTWPDSTMVDGFSFLVSYSYPIIEPTQPTPRSMTGWRGCVKEIV